MKRALIVLVAVVGLVACSNGELTPPTITPMPTSTSTLTPSITPTKTNTPTYTPTVTPAPVPFVLISPDGNYFYGELFVGSEVNLYPVASSIQALWTDEKPQDEATWLSNSSAIIIGNSLWSVPDGKLLYSVESGDLAARLYANGISFEANIYHVPAYYTAPMTVRVLSTDQFVRQLSLPSTILQKAPYSQFFFNHVYNHQGTMLAGAFAWIPDGRTPTYSAIVVWDIASGDEVFQMDSEDVQYSSVSWSPGDRFILLEDTGTWWNVETEQPVELPVEGGNWTLDDSKYYSINNDELSVWETNEFLLLFRQTLETASRVIWSPDSTLFAIGPETCSSETELVIFDGINGNQQNVIGKGLVPFGINEANTYMLVFDCSANQVIALPIQRSIQ